MLLNDRRHFRKGDLIYALADGFNDEERRRALLHFGGGCRVCWGRLKELKDAPVRLDTSYDCVARALGRTLGALRGVDEVPVMMTAVHLYWVGRVERDPAAFARLVIEEANLLDVEAPRVGLNALKDAVKLLAVPRWLVFGRARRHDLATLAHLYLGYAYHTGGSLLKIDGIHEVRLATGHRRRGSGDPEIRALELIIGSWVDGSEPRLGERLRVAEQVLCRFLETHPSPGHLAELRIYQGLAAERRGDLVGARARFGDAAAHMPERCVHGRFFVAYHLAALSLVAGDQRSLEHYQGQAEHLAEKLDPSVTAERLERLRMQAMA